MRVGEAVESSLGSGDLSWPLRRAALLYGDRLALVDGDLELTYAQLYERVAALAGGIAELGIRDGARVGYLGANSVHNAECWFGVPAAGGVFVDLNWRLSVPELEYIVNDSGISVMFADAARLGSALELRSRCESVTDVVLVGADAASASAEAVKPYEELLHHGAAQLEPRGRDELAGICYTGGTTGRPKGVMLSHGNLLANALHNIVATGHEPGQRWLHVPPMFHVAGTSNLFACTWAGCEQYFVPGFQANGFIEAVRTHSITHTILVPTMLSMLLDELERDPAGERLPSLAHIQYAASPITPALQRRTLEFFDCDIVQFYGMTEAAPTVTRLSGEAHRRGIAGEEPDAQRLSSIGVPVIGVEAAVLDADGQPLPPGEVGELCVRGPNVMVGYWNHEQATASALSGGWYHSGDAAWADADGYLYLVDRLKDMIITGGENVYSIEVEAALAEHPAVSEVAVIGIPDARWGEAVHAVVAVLPGAAVTETELIDNCRSLIAGFKVPRSIELRTDPLPKSGPGKILKAQLRAPFWAGHERRVN